MFKKITRLFSERVASAAMRKMSTNIDYAMQCLARDSSAQFIMEHLPQAEKVYSRDQILKLGSEMSAGINGCVCEFGVFKGYTLKELAKYNPNKTVNGFDSFEGLPTNWRSGFLKGEFKTEIPTFHEKNIEIYKGLFNETIPEFLKKLDTPIALLHIDCDLYSSTKCVFDALWDHLADNAVIVFDEYFNYPGWEHHEHKALMELNTNFKYIAYNPVGEQLMIVKK